MIDLVGRDASSFKLSLQDLAQVDMWALAFAWQQHGRHRRDRLKRPSNVVSHFEAAQLDVRTDGGDALAGATGECAQRIDGVRDDVLFGSAPAAVHGDHCAAATIADEHGRAIGHADPAGDAAMSRGNGVPGDTRGVGGVTRWFHDVHVNTVNLVEQQDGIVAHAERLGGDP
jgi:hypothetical protein